ncbi:MAG TPA: XdhC family protein [Actinomycetes bacterium]|nr:XdhC family protein [Actinomycetes bacterium]
MDHGTDHGHSQHDGHEHEHSPAPAAAADPACALAHGELDPTAERRTLVAVFASPVARYLLHFGRDLGYQTVLVDPDPAQVTVDDKAHADAVATAIGPDVIDRATDVVVTDHDRAELGPMLRDALGQPARWIGVMGSLRHTAPHLEALRRLGVGEPEIARVHRPIGLNIGSRTPPEIAVATLAGLLADRAGRPGGFAF